MPQSRYRLAHHWILRVAPRHLTWTRSAICTATHDPLIASTGAAFAIVELVDHDALAGSRVNSHQLAELLVGTEIHAIHIHTRDRGDPKADLRARMYAPAQGIAKDAATGSANCALAGMLAQYTDQPDGE